MEIFREFTFEAAHRLPHVPAGPQVRSPARTLLPGRRARRRDRSAEDTGWVRDFAELSCAFAPLLARLDHYYLNEVEGLDNPTSEVLAEVDLGSPPASGP